MERMERKHATRDVSLEFQIGRDEVIEASGHGDKIVGTVIQTVELVKAAKE